MLFNSITSLFNPNKSIEGIIYYTDVFELRVFLQPYSDKVFISDKNDKAIRKFSTFLKEEFAKLPIYSTVFED